MANKNKFSEFKSEFDAVEWNNYIPLNSYEHKQVNELPDFIKNNGLTNNFNSALIVASGSTDYNFYGVIGYRPDENNTVIDEHAFVYLVHKPTNNVIGGILHHADYEGRTSTIPIDIQEALTISGVTASISSPRMPKQISGSLDDLLDDGILSGVSANFNISFKKLKDK